jgi:hypothetical protein
LIGGWSATGPEGAADGACLASRSVADSGGVTLALTAADSGGVAVVNCCSAAKTTAPKTVTSAATLSDVTILLIPEEDPDSMVHSSLVFRRERGDALRSLTDGASLHHQTSSL